MSTAAKADCRGSEIRARLTAARHHVARVRRIADSEDMISQRDVRRALREAAECLDNILACIGDSGVEG